MRSITACAVIYPTLLRSRKRFAPAHLLLPRAPRARGAARGLSAAGRCLRLGGTTPKLAVTYTVGAMYMGQRASGRRRPRLQQPAAARAGRRRARRARGARRRGRGACACGGRGSGRAAQCQGAKGGGPGCMGKKEAGGGAWRAADGLHRCGALGFPSGLVKTALYASDGVTKGLARQNGARAAGQGRAAPKRAHTRRRFGAYKWAGGSQQTAGRPRPWRLFLLGRATAPCGRRAARSRPAGQLAWLGGVHAGFASSVAPRAGAAQGLQRCSLRGPPCLLCCMCLHACVVSV